MLRYCHRMYSNVTQRLAAGSEKGKHLNARNIKKCPSCDADLTAGSVNESEKRTHGAAAMEEWEDVEVTTTLRCLSCFELIEKRSRSHRVFTSL